MLYSLVLVTVSAHFTSCLGNNVNENSPFNDFLMEYSYIKSVQHRWTPPKSILQCSCSSEAVTVLSEHFHQVTSIQPALICIRNPPQPSPGAAAGSLQPGRVPKKGPKSSFENKRMHSENELTERVCWGFFPFPFPCVHVCVYIL